MVATFKICDNSGTTLYDFLDHDNFEFTIRRGTLRSRPREGLVDETFIAVSRDADTDIWGSESALDIITERINLYNSSVFQKNPIWLYTMQGSETEKRSLITNLDVRPISIGDSHMISDGLGAYRQVTITRLDNWERGALANSVDWYGGYESSKLAYKTIAPLGNMPARIHYAIIRGEGIVGTTNPLYRCWMGIRENLEGLTDFDPLLECESTAISGGMSTLGTDTTNTSDGNASNAYKATCSFSTVATMAKRLSIKLEDVGASLDCDDFIGRYLILLRAKVSNGTTVASVKATGGFYGSSDELFAPAGDPVYIDGSVSTSWLHYPLGELSIPPFPLYTAYYPIGTGSMDKYTIQIHAERVAGSGNLELDSIILMPCERLAYLEGGAVQYSSGDLDPMYLYTTEAGLLIAYAEVGGNPMNDVSYSLSGSKPWEMPPYNPAGYSMMVVLAEEEDAHDITDGWEVRIRMVGRYKNRNIN